MRLKAVTHQSGIAAFVRLPRSALASSLAGSILLGTVLLSVAGCTSRPLIAYSTEATPAILAPVSVAGVIDARPRFREILCQVMEQHGRELPDYRPCEQVLVRLVDEGQPSGRPLNLGPTTAHFQVLFVPGLGWTCFEHIVQPSGTVARHLTQLGHEVSLMEVGALSGSGANAKVIRDKIMAMPAPEGPKRIVLIGYSKGAVDILEAIAGYPELQSRVAAVVSLAGSVGGSALANDASQSMLDLLRHIPGAECDAGDNDALTSLKPAVRQAWLAHNPLPNSIRFYSLVTYPAPEQISRVLRPSYNKLGQIDARNDSQMIFYDQVIPASVLLGYLNADHWAVGVPINRSHPVLASVLVDKNAFPREVLMEALLRFIEEDLQIDHASAARTPPEGVPSSTRGDPSRMIYADHFTGDGSVLFR